nr:MAG TPA: HNHc [Caudoviricetes sp.]
MNKRKRQDDALFRKTKIQAYERDYGLCVLCGRQAVEVHHIVFRSQLGTSELSNLACLCRSCHDEAHGVRAKEIRRKLKEIINDTNTT